MKLAVVCITCAFAAQAHEIGTTRVSAIFQHDVYKIDIVTDAAALDEKMAGSSGGPFDDRFLTRVTVAFDESKVRPKVSYSMATSRTRSCRATPS